MEKIRGRAFAFRPLVTCIALSFPLLPAIALADPTLAASGSFDLGPAQISLLGTPKSGQFDQPATSAPFSVGAFGTPQSAYDTSASVYAVTLANGIFGATAVTSEIEGAHATLVSEVKLVFTDSVTNTSGVAGDANLALAISSLGFAFAYGASTDAGPGGVNRASFVANVYVGGSTSAVWSTAFSWDNWVYTSSGVDIGLSATQPSTCSYGGLTCSFGTGAFGITDYLTSVALGSVAAGQTLDIRYEIELSTETDLYGGSAAIYFNDPSSLTLSSTPAASLTLDVASPTAVPEPETYLMMAAGLGVLAAGVRRRRNKR